MRKIVLHIGAEKTGTTTIQEFLALNRDRLRELGVYFPKAVGEKNHTHLALCAALDKRGISKRAAGRLAENGLEDFRLKIRKSLDDELAKNLPCDTVVFSGEHMHSQLQTPEELERLKQMLPKADELRIVFYIRRQDQAAVSLFSTALKAGGGGGEGFQFPEDEAGRLPYRFDYLRAYKLWASVFGKESIVVRIFDKAEFVNGDLIEDFCHAAGLPWEKDFLRPQMKNPALDANGEFVFSRFNALRNAEGNTFSEHDLRTLKELLVNSFTSKSKNRPTRESAISFFRQFQQVNARLRKQAFPGRKAPLFNDDFSEYPVDKSAPAETVDLGVICDVLLKAWLEQAKQASQAKFLEARKMRRGKASSGAKRLLHFCAAAVRRIIPGREHAR